MTRTVRDDPKWPAHFDAQAAACRAMGAPFNARVCDWLRDALDDRSLLGARVLDWPAANRGGDLVPIRCFAGFHALARSGRVPALSAVYPPATADDAALHAALAEALSREDAFLAGWLDSPPQTNEVGRSAILLGGLLALSGRVGRPIALHEIGASAGLNMQFDRWRYDLGHGGFWGVTNAPVLIQSEWTGAAPSVDQPLEIVSRRAADLRPLDAGNPEHRERLLAFIWPDQTARFQRIAAALDVAAASGLTVEQADARDWVARVLSPDEAREGVAAVLFHSVFIQYLDPATRQALVDDLFRRGAAASAASPFAWLRMEAGDDRATCELRLTVWPAGDTLRLAEVDWHGRWARWL